MTPRAINGMPFQVTLKQENANQVVRQVEWCLEHCNGQFKDVNLYNDRVWYFEDEKDAMLFALQFSEDKT